MRSVLPEAYSRYVRRLLDLVLLAAALGAIGFGVYKLGNRVDSTSHNLAKHDSELTQPVTHRSSHHVSRRTVELVVVGIGCAAGVMVLVSMTGAMSRRRRRQRWRAT